MDYFLSKNWIKPFKKATVLIALNVFDVIDACSAGNVDDVDSVGHLRLILFVGNERNVLELFGPLESL